MSGPSWRSRDSVCQQPESYPTAKERPASCYLLSPLNVRNSSLSEYDVNDEIVKRLREEAKSRADFSKVHACVPSGDVSDDLEARMVILGPEHPHTVKDVKSAARKEAAAVLEARGSSPRNYKNTLVFLAPDINRLRELQQAVRQFLAWKSIW